MITWVCEGCRNEKDIGGTLFQGRKVCTACWHKLVRVDDELDRRIKTNYTDELAVAAEKKRREKLKE